MIMKTIKKISGSPIIVNSLAYIDCRVEKIFSIVWFPKNHAFFSLPNGARLYLNLSSWLLKIKNLVCKKLANNIIKNTFRMRD